MSAPDRPTREQIDADLREVDALATYAPDCAHRLAAEVRALRAELAKVNIEVGRAWLALPHGPHPALHDDSLAGHIRAALVARTPQPAEPGPNPTHLELCGTAALLTVWRTATPGGVARLARRIDVDPRCLTLSGSVDARSRATVEHAPQCSCDDLGGRLVEGHLAPLPAVPDGEDDEESGLLGLTQSAAQARMCSCCNGDPLTVCAACEQHSCWAGRFMCEDAPFASTKRMSDGEDVPARLDAAADAIDAHNPYSCAGGNLRSIATSLRLSSPETCAAVAAALARPTEREQ